MNLVVGSGPSGVMAARALLERGQEVLMVDAGTELEPERRALADRLAATGPESWPPRAAEPLRTPVRDAALKLAFGSDFPYARADQAALDQRGTRCVLSLAKGGLSNVWGAAALPAPADELDGWPFDAAALAPHYAAAEETLGLAGARDRLEALFPFHAAPRPPAPLGLQGRALLAHWESRADALARAGFVFGRARLAVRTRDEAAGRACCECGLCMSGCPYGAIWNSAAAVAELSRRPGFSYRGGLRVASVAARGSGAVVLARPLAGGSEQELSGRRVFLACGPVETARVVVRALRLFGRELALRYQPYFLLPVALTKGVPGVAGERALTLAQAFLDFREGGAPPRLVHVQAYGSNEYVADRIARTARWAGPWRAAASRALSGRLMALQGYLHSSRGGAIRLVGRDDGSLSLSAPSQLGARARVAAVAARLAARSSDLGFVPLLPFLRAGAPGEGNHVGGTFPMRAAPGALETDLLGRLPGLPGVHLVDSSVLPSLPAPSLTLTVMANAHRIANAAAEGA